jgi:hypothetical protein
MAAHEGDGIGRWLELGEDEHATVSVVIEEAGL